MLTKTFSVGAGPFESRHSLRKASYDIYRQLEQSLAGMLVQVTVTHLTSYFVNAVEVI
jgi:hypothetical protein